jgi:hypothetical protein
MVFDEKGAIFIAPFYNNYVGKNIEDITKK